MFDVAVIGGGPAGMMAAGRAAEVGARVVLIEGNSRPGRKLLLTGNGRCNLANSTLDKSRLVEVYGKNGKFLYSAFSRFGTAETLEFFRRQGIRLKEEEGGKVFPVSDRAVDVLDCLQRYMEKGGVTLITDIRVEGLVREGDDIKRALLHDREIVAGSFIVCTGGRSFPATGSDGEAFHWLKALGHTVMPLLPALSPVTVAEKWLREAEGASLRGVVLRAFRDGKKVAEEPGECMVTRDGLSGPAALNLSRKLTGLVRAGDVQIAIDFRPDVNLDRLDAELVRTFRDRPNSLLRNITEELVPPKFAPVMLAACGVDGEARVNKVARSGRLRLAGALKGLELTLKGIKGFERAMVTRGGVSLSEVDSKAMRSKLVRNLYFAGEALDLDGPTGGYNLQICWTTGWAAGS